VKRVGGKVLICPWLNGAGRTTQSTILLANVRRRDMEKFPVDFHDMKASFFRGDFPRVISLLDGLRFVMPVEELPLSVFGYGGLARYYSGDFLGATIQYSEGLGCNPNCREILSNYAYLLACCPDWEFHDGAKAVMLAERACELSQWADDTDVGTLAAAYARLGDYEKAETYILLAITLSPPHKHDAYVRHLCAVRSQQAITGDVIDDFKRLQRDYGET
jgi:tetratricopeptide (TPR) repeat protein